MAGSPPHQPPSAPPTSSGASPTVFNSAVDRRAPRLRPPRSLPPWIASYEEGFGPAPLDQLQLLTTPKRAVQPQHNTTPSELERRVSKDGFEFSEDPRLGPAQESRHMIPHFLRYGRASMRGRKWDHLRSAEPVIVAGYGSTTTPATTWRDYIRSSAWGRMPNEKSEIVDKDFLNGLQPTFNDPVGIPLHPVDSRSSRRRRTVALYKRIWNVVLGHTLTPFLFRLTVMITSIIALGISARIFTLEEGAGRNGAERAQSAVAVAVDTVAIPYIGYMIWDEFMGKPLGLRSAVSKISLILLDLFFIIFKSASTALAFEGLVYHTIKRENVRRLTDALATFMLIGLIAWTMNFTVNIFRTVKRLGVGDDNDDDETRV